MKVRELIEYLKTLDQDASVWEMYDPPYACQEISLTHLAGDDADYAIMFRDYGVQVGDYAVICG